MQHVDVDALDAAIGAGATVVDVRESVEYAEGHVPGARSIPMGQVPARLHELDRSAPVYVICASGNRSQAITELLTAAGFEAANVAGGTRAWIASGRRVEGGASWTS